MKQTFANYSEYLKGIFLEFDWGVNRQQDDVWDIFKEKYPYTLKLNFIAFIFYVSMGIIIGYVQALKKGSLFDRMFTIISLMISSIPIYILMFLVVITVGATWHILPYHFIRNEQWISYILPVMVLSVAPITTFSRVVRNEVLELLTADHILLARVKGLTKRQATVRHTFRSSIVALIPELPTVFLFALTGSFFVEMIYYVPGVARDFYESIISIGDFNVNYVTVDIPVTMLVMLFYILVSMIFITFIDLLTPLIDPRVRFKKEKG